MSMRFFRNLAKTNMIIRKMTNIFHNAIKIRKYCRLARNSRIRSPEIPWLPTWTWLHSVFAEWWQFVFNLQPVNVFNSNNQSQSANYPQPVDLALWSTKRSSSCLFLELHRKHDSAFQRPNQSRTHKNLIYSQFEIQHSASVSDQCPENKRKLMERQAKKLLKFKDMV